jgi:hypothetical protein
VLGRPRHDLLGLAHERSPGSLLCALMPRRGSALDYQFRYPLLMIWLGWCCCCRGSFGCLTASLLRPLMERTLGTEWAAGRRGDRSSHLRRTTATVGALMIGLILRLLDQRPMTGSYQRTRL